MRPVDFKFKSFVSIHTSKEMKDHKLIMIDFRKLI